MYKLLLVDDERIIRESISKLINWEEYGFVLIGAVQNGIEAYEIICREEPHLIITDMKMPVMSGLQLIEKVKKRFPDIETAVLSGHNAFEYTAGSMKHGVNHYLLKPCNENDVIQVLLDVRKKLINKENREKFIKKNNEKLEKVIPLVREQFIRDFIMSRQYNNEELDYFMTLFNLKDKKVRTIIFQPSKEYNFNTLFALMNMIKKQHSFENICFQTVINKHLLLIVEHLPDEKVEGLLNELLETFKFLIGQDLVVAYSREGDFTDVSRIYQQTDEYLDYAFYLGNSCVISYKDVEKGMCINEPIEMDIKEIVGAVKAGNQKVFLELIKEYFQTLSRMKIEINSFKFCCIELATGILKYCHHDKRDIYIQKLLEIQLQDSMEAISYSIISVGEDVVSMNYKGITHRHNKIVQTMLQKIEDHLNEEYFSLNWLANNVLYMNAGYLSKLFSKGVGETFSQYLMARRMEKAKEIINVSHMPKIYEIAEAVGMGNNPQYFSQLFKKYVGLTPSEYKNRL